MTAHDLEALRVSHRNALTLVVAIPADHPLHAAAVELLADTTSALAAVA